MVSGDAVCSLSPIYAQGMTVAIAEARALGRVVDAHAVAGVGRRFFRQTRPLVDTAWTLATGADLAHAEVEGPRPASWRLVTAYVNRLAPVAHRDPVVANTFMKVHALMVPPPHLLHPRVLTRVLLEKRLPAGQRRGEPVRSG